MLISHSGDCFKFNRKLIPLSKVSFGELKALKFWKKGSLTTLKS